MVLYTRYLVPFEVVSVVLLVAMIGAIVFGRRDPVADSGAAEVEQ
jgi:NADH:ubiquinone oxidoreductase subunit 6 (subunit J)